MPISSSLSAKAQSIEFQGFCTSPIYEGDISGGSFQLANPTCNVATDLKAPVAYAQGTQHTCAWLNVDPITGALTGSPSESDQGSCDVSVAATDSTIVLETAPLTIQVLNYCKAPNQAGLNSFASRGTGLVGSPYLICNSTQFMNIGMIACGNGISSSCNAQFRLRDNIDFAGLPTPHIPIGGYSAASPAVSQIFTGGFNGSGYSVSNFSFNDSAANGMGLIRRLSGSQSKIDNLRLINSNITGGTGTGLVAGYLMSGAIINKTILIGGSVIGVGYVGGVAGGLSGSVQVTDTISNASVEGVNTGVGGIAGYTDSGSKIIKAACTGSVTSISGQAGGITGALANGSEIQKSSMSGDLTCVGACGGLVGYSYGGKISLSSFSGNLTASGGDIGGLVGWMNMFGGDGFLVDSFAIGRITSSGSTGGVGGMIGYLQLQTGSFKIDMHRNYYAALTQLAMSGGLYQGGVIGRASGTTTTLNISSNYWAQNVESNRFGSNGSSANDDNTSAVGLMFVNMDKQSSYPGFDFSAIWTTKTDTSLPRHQ